MQTVTYVIPNISCHHCVRTIQNELSELEGVKEVRGDVAHKTITVVFEAPTNEAAIKTLLAEINYPAQEG